MWGLEEPSSQDGSEQEGPHEATGIGHCPGHQGLSGYLNPAPTLDLIQDRLKSVEIFPLLPWASSQTGSGVRSSWDRRQTDRRKARAELLPGSRVNAQVGFAAKGTRRP